MQFLPPLRRASSHRFDSNGRPFLHGDSLPYATDGLSDKGKEQLFAVVYIGDRSTTYIWHIKMCCGHTTTASTVDGRAYQPSTHRRSERRIRRAVVMVARGITEVDDDSTGKEPQ